MTDRRSESLDEPTDHELAEFESALRLLRPAPLSAEFQRRLAGAIETRPRAARYFWALLGAAALGVLAVGVGLARSRRVAQFEPVFTLNLLTSATDEGDVTLGDGTPARQIRASYVQTTKWKDAGSKATVTWTVPSEELQIVPLSYE
jgi:hypothetical protein